MRKKIRRILLTGFAAILAFAVFLFIQDMTGNFHEVFPGEFYRSAQIEPGDIARYEKEYGIRTVLNLRGSNRGSEWYDE